MPALDDVLIRPLLTEKTAKGAERNTERLYTFVVNRAANKIEIRKAVEQKYGVEVAKVRTLIMPSKPKNRFTKSRVIFGRTKVIKKAVVKLAGDHVIDFQDNL